jgi:hypothetical protein
LKVRRDNNSQTSTIYIHLFQKTNPTKVISFLSFLFRGLHNFLASNKLI